MKKLFFYLMIIGLSVQVGYAQKRTDYKKERNLVSVFSYHENGQIAQEGYLKRNKLHGEWVSYSENGVKLAQGQYLNGKKIGKWFFWNARKMTEVTFQDNKAVKAVVWEKGALVAIN